MADNNVFISYENQQRTVDKLRAEIKTKMDAKDIDTAPTQSSGNLVESGGVYTAVAGCVQKSEMDDITQADIDAMFA